MIATFEGEIDPATGAITIHTVPAPAVNGLVVFQPYKDGAPGTGPDNTLELVTELVGVPPPAVVLGACNPGDAFEGSITVRSFFRNQTFDDVYVELTSVAPSGFEACNSAASRTGVSNAYGLWSYGSLGLKGTSTDHKTQLWRFHFPSSQQFTFQGRIMATLNRPVAISGGPEFDWTPTSIVTPRSTFRDVPTTTSHVVWNGTAFADTLNKVTFVPTDAAYFAGANHPVGLWDPAESWVGPFTNTAYFVASPLNGGNAIDTSGNFTVCAKFKPGTQPIGLPNKIIVGKGQAESPANNTEGWALMQMHDMFCFHYLTAADAGLGRIPTMAYSGPGLNPEQNAYDYHCGGRNGNVIHSAAHGWDENTYTSENVITGSFANPANLPLVIGAYPDGSGAEDDGGVYEVIFDSRPATIDVMREIVSDAEAGRLPGSVGASALYVSPRTAATSVLGADGMSYTLPPHAVVPLAADGTGLLAEGTIVDYTHPLAEDTSTTGFCVGAEIVADGAWSAVSGGVLSIVDDLRMSLNPFNLFMPNGSAQDNFTVESGWSAGSAHTFKACASAAGAIVLYGDGTQLTTGAASGPISNLGAGSFRIGIGGYPPTPLSGARIRRVFACPTSVAASCG